MIITNNALRVVRLPTNDTTEAPAHTPVDIQGDTTFDTHEVGTPVDATADTTVDAPKAHAIEESREQQLTFSSWGTPAARTGPGKAILIQRYSDEFFG